MKFFRQFLTIISITLLTSSLIFISGCKEDEYERIVVAYFEFTPESGTVDTVFSFDASNSGTKYVNYSTPLSHRNINCSWDFENDGTFEIIDKPCATVVTHQFKESDAHQVLLKVTSIDYSIEAGYTTRTVPVLSDLGDNCYENFHAPCPNQHTVNYAGKDYKTAQIGNQCWLAENLNIGQTMNSSTYPSDNDTIEKFCVNDVAGNCDEVGGLYTWKEAMNYSTDPQGICPDGWHIPTSAEWDELANYLGGYGDVSAWKMMACEDDPWGLGANTTTNESGFTAFPTGYYWIWFDWETQRAYYWSSDAYDADQAHYRYLDFQQGFVGLDTLDQSIHNYKSNSMCIRCIRD